MTTTATTTTTTTTHESHLVKHTDFISSTLGASFVGVWVMHLRTHVAHPRLPHGRTAARANRSRGRHPCRATGTGHVRRVGSLNSLAIVHLRHPTNASTSQSGVLVAVAPAVDRSLNKSSLAAKTRVKLGQRPSDGITLRLIL